MFKLFKENEKKIKIDFYDMPEMEKLEAYQKMNDPQILRLLRSRYTDALTGMVIDKGDEAENLRGRILELANLIDSAENIEKTLLHINEHKEKQDKKRSAIKTLKNKLLTKKTNEINTK